MYKSIVILVLLGCTLSFELKGEDCRGFYFFTRSEDELKTAIRKATDKEEKARLLMELSKFYQQRNFIEARAAVFEARRWALETKNASLLADSYLMEAQLHFIGYVGDSARILINQALRYSEGVSDPRSKAYALVWLAIYYVNSSNRGEFIDNLKTADEIFRNIGNEEGRLFIKSTMASQLSSIDLTREAINLIVQASNQFNQAELKLSEIILMQQLADAYRLMKNNDSAIQILQNILPQTQVPAYKFIRANVLRQMATIALFNKNYDEALQKLNEAYEITSNLRLDRTSADILTMLANIYHETGNDDLSVLMNHKVWALRRQMKFPGILINTLINLGVLALEQKQIDTAIFWLERGFQKANEIGNNRALNIAGTFLSRAYELDGNYQKAFEVFKRKAEAESKINNLIAVNASIALNSAVLEAKTKKILENRKLSYRRNIMFLYGILLLFFLLIIVLIFWWQRSKILLKEKRNRVREEMLRQQMNPHFIFNALIAIQSFIYQKKSLDAVKFLENFSSLIRLMLVSSQSDYISVKDDIDIITNYLRIQKLRFEEKFDFSVECDPQILTNEVSIPPLLTQPFVENSIEHGFNGIEGKGFIQVKYGLGDGVIIISITDNGKGIDPTYLHGFGSLKNHKPMGIQVTKERIEILNKEHKGKNILFKIGTLEAPGAPYPGTRVEFSLPLNKFDAQ